MRLYVANATSKRFEFHYSVPGQQKRRQQTIEPFGQIVLADDLDEGQINAIVDQHEKYGFPNAEDVSQSRGGAGAKKFYGQCYAIDKPVSSARIETLVRGNQVVLDARGRKLREHAAIASNNEVTRALSRQNEMQMDSKIEVANFELTVQQDLKDGDDTSTRDAIADGFRVGGAADAAPKGKSRR